VLRIQKLTNDQVVFTRSGRLRWLHHDATRPENDFEGAVGMGSSALDGITESENQLRLMIDTIPTLAWSCWPDGRTEFLNQRWLDYTGLSTEESLGWGWKTSIHSEDLGKLMNTWMRLLACGEAGVRVAGRWTYLYRAIDSEGNTIDFMLSPKRDRNAAKQFLQIALRRAGHLRPRVINVDGHPAYASVTAELQQTGELGPRCRCRPCPYLNNIIEQDHRFIKKRITASLWFRSFDGALRTIAVYEAMHMIRKGQIRWLAKGDVAAQVQFIHAIFGLQA
jgi:IS6 family transposase